MSLEHRAALRRYAEAVAELRDCEHDAACTTRDLDDAVEALRVARFADAQAHTALAIARLNVAHAGRATMRAVTHEATRRVLLEER
jgi:hypothetical protein